MSDAGIPGESIREMQESEVEAVVDGVFRAYPELERGLPKEDVFGGRAVDFSVGGMVREEIAAMFTGTRYGMPFETKTVVAVRAGEVVGSASMYRGSECWQLGYVVRPDQGDADQLMESVAQALMSACESWGESPGFVPRTSPPWFHV